jgi:hypothetical protein
MNCELRPIILGMCYLVCISTPLLNLAEMKVHCILTIIQLPGGGGELGYTPWRNGFVFSDTKATVEPCRGSLFPADSMQAPRRAHYQVAAAPARSAQYSVPVTPCVGRACHPPPTAGHGLGI